MANDKFTVVGTNIAEKATMIWNVADMLRGPFKPHEYGLVICLFPGSMPLGAAHGVSQDSASQHWLRLVKHPLSLDLLKPPICFAQVKLLFLYSSIVSGHLHLSVQDKLTLYE